MRKYFPNHGYINCVPLSPFFRVQTEYTITENGCWEWNGKRDKNGYGKLIYENYQLAHRISYLVHKGDPTGSEVCHHCDNPPCINPDHLWLGSHADNMADMKMKQRAGIPQHPSLSAYKQGCRCPECTEINREYKRQWKKDNPEKVAASRQREKDKRNKK